MSARGENINYIAGVILRDIDGDGRLDIAISYMNSKIDGKNPNSNGTVVCAGSAVRFAYDIYESSTYKMSIFRNVPGANLSFSHTAFTFEGANPSSAPIVYQDGSGVCANFRAGSYYSVMEDYSLSSLYPSYPTINPYARNITIADFDGDGKPDIAIAKQLASNVSIYRNISTSGTISYNNSLTFPVGSSSSYDLAAGDLDRDGRPDLVVANNGSSNVSVLKNRSVSGTLSFTTATTLNVAANPQAIGFGDFDNDGNLDIAVASNTSPGVLSIFRNTVGSSSGTISLPTNPSITLNTGNNPFGLTIADADGDGLVDIAVENTGASTVQVFKNTTVGSALSFTNRLNYVTASSPQGIVIGDMNNDGKPDMATSGNGNRLSFYRNLATNILPPAVTQISPLSSTIGSSITITGQNFNANPTDNIVFFGTTSATVTGGTSTTLNVLVPLGASYQYISVTDRTTKFTGYSANLFVVTYSSTGITDFAPAVNFGTGAASSFNQQVIKDFNNDGKPDVVVATTSGLYLLTNRTTPGSSAISFTVLSFNLPSSPNIRALATDDLDGDGMPDLALNNTTNSIFLVYKNTSAISGSLSFTNTNVSLTSDSFYAIAINDIDMDGRPDVVMGGNNGTAVYVYRNTSASGIITFDPAITTFATGASAYALVIGDIDGDGKPDLLTANATNSNLSILRNTSTGPGSITFASVVNISSVSGQNSRSMALGDFNADGKLDVVLDNYGNGTILSAFLNKAVSGTISTGSFSPSFTLTALPSNNTQAVAVGDVDGDGKVDIVAANNTTTTLISVLDNIG